MVDYYDRLRVSVSEYFVEYGYLDSWDAIVESVSEYFCDFGLDDLRLICGMISEEYERMIYEGEVD